MSINSRAKGKNGELEAVRFLKEHGYTNAKRGVQYNGRNGDADVVDALPGVHLEIKRVERLNVQDAIDQSKRDAREGEMPIVLHRRNHCKWLVTLDAEDFLRLYRDWEGDDE